MSIADATALVGDGARPRRRALRSDPRQITVRAAVLAVLAATAFGIVSAGARVTAARADAARSAATVARCPGWGRPAVAADPAPHAVRVFAIQLAQTPATMATAGDYTRAIDCALRTEVVPHLAVGRPNVVVFDEDVGLQTLAIGPRGRGARALLRRGDPACTSGPPCLTLATLAAVDTGYAHALAYLEPRFPTLGGQLGRGFVAATDQFVRVFMTTMADAARRYRVYVIASNTQAPFRLTHAPGAVAALASPPARAAYAPTRGIAYDQTFVWSPHVVHRGEPAPLANLLADNEKVPLTSFESALGFGSGPATGAAAARNLAPIPIPGTDARLGIATSLPAFVYGPATSHPCADVALTYMRCLNRLGANVVIQADANDGAWTGVAGAEPWQPLAWMGSAYRAVTDPTVDFSYAVNPFMVGNLADTPFDGQSAILQRGLTGAGCAYVGDRTVLAGHDIAADRRYAGLKPQFLALAPWVVPDGSRASLARVGAALAAGVGPRRYVQTALIADLPFPADRRRGDCVEAGR